MATDRDNPWIKIRFGPSNFGTMPQHHVAAAARELEGALNAATARAERAEAERDRLAAAETAVRAILAEDPPGTVHPAAADTRADLTARITAIYDQEAT